MIIVIAKDLRIGDKENPEMLVIRRRHGLGKIRPPQERPPKAYVLVEQNHAKDEHEEHASDGQLEK